MVLLLPLCGALCRSPKSKLQWIAVFLPSLMLLLIGFVILFNMKRDWISADLAPTLRSFGVFALNWAILPALAVSLGICPSFVGHKWKKRTGGQNALM
jgi:hypothetical protein